MNKKRCLYCGKIIANGRYIDVSGDMTIVNYAY